MKPSLILAVLLVSACGQSGDLYLPDNPPPEVQKREQRAQKEKPGEPQSPAPVAQP